MQIDFTTPTTISHFTESFDTSNPLTHPTSLRSSKHSTSRCSNTLTFSTPVRPGSNITSRRPLIANDSTNQSTTMVASSTPDTTANPLVTSNPAIYNPLTSAITTAHPNCTIASNPIYNAAPPISKTTSNCCTQAIPAKSPITINTSDHPKSNTTATLPRSTTPTTHRHISHIGSNSSTISTNAERSATATNSDTQNITAKAPKTTTTTDPLKSSTMTRSTTARNHTPSTINSYRPILPIGSNGPTTTGYFPKSKSVNDTSRCTLTNDPSRSKTTDNPTTHPNTHAFRARSVSVPDPPTSVTNDNPSIVTTADQPITVIGGLPASNTASRNTGPNITANNPTANITEDRPASHDTPNFPTKPAIPILHISFPGSNIADDHPKTNTTSDGLASYHTHTIPAISPISSLPTSFPGSITTYDTSTPNNCNIQSESSMVNFSKYNTTANPSVHTSTTNPNESTTISNTSGCITTTNHPESISTSCPHGSIAITNPLPTPTISVSTSTSIAAAADPPRSTTVDNQSSSTIHADPSSSIYFMPNTSSNHPGCINPTISTTATASGFSSNTIPLNATTTSNPFESTSNENLLTYTNADRSATCTNSDAEILSAKQLKSSTTSGPPKSVSTVDLSRSTSSRNLTRSASFSTASKPIISSIGSNWSTTTGKPAKFMPVYNPAATNIPVKPTRPLSSFNCPKIVDTSNLTSTADLIAGQSETTIASSHPGSNITDNPPKINTTADGLASYPISNLPTLIPESITTYNHSTLYTSTTDQNESTTIGNTSGCISTNLPESISTSCPLGSIAITNPLPTPTISVNTSTCIAAAADPRSATVDNQSSSTIHADPSSSIYFMPNTSSNHPGCINPTISATATASGFSSNTIPLNATTTSNPFESTSNETYTNADRSATCTNSDAEILSAKQLESSTTSGPPKSVSTVDLSRSTSSRNLTRSASFSTASKPIISGIGSNWSTTTGKPAKFMPVYNPAATNIPVKPTRPLSSFNCPKIVDTSNLTSTADLIAGQSETTIASSHPGSNITDNPPKINTTADGLASYHTHTIPAISPISSLPTLIPGSITTYNHSTLNNSDNPCESSMVNFSKYNTTANSSVYTSTTNQNESTTIGNTSGCISTNLPESISTSCPLGSIAITNPLPTPTISVNTSTCIAAVADPRSATVDNQSSSTIHADPSSSIYSMPNTSSNHPGCINPTISTTATASGFSSNTIPPNATTKSNPFESTSNENLLTYTNADRSATCTNSDAEILSAKQLESSTTSGPPKSVSTVDLSRSTSSRNLTRSASFSTASKPIISSIGSNWSTTTGKPAKFMPVYNPAATNIPVKPTRPLSSFNCPKIVDTSNLTSTADRIAGQSETTIASCHPGSNITDNPPKTNTTANGLASYHTHTISAISPITSLPTSLPESITTYNPSTLNNYNISCDSSMVNFSQYNTTANPSVYTSTTNPNESTTIGNTSGCITTTNHPGSITTSCPHGSIAITNPLPTPTISVNTSTSIAAAADPPRSTTVDNQSSSTIHANSDAEILYAKQFKTSTSSGPPKSVSIADVSRSTTSRNLTQSTSVSTASRPISSIGSNWSTTTGETAKFMPVYNSAATNIPVKPTRPLSSFNCPKIVNTSNLTSTADRIAGQSETTIASSHPGSNITDNPPKTNTTADGLASYHTHTIPAISPISSLPTLIPGSITTYNHSTLNNSTSTNSPSRSSTTDNSTTHPTTLAILARSMSVDDPPKLTSNDNPSVVTTPISAMPNIPVRPPRLSRNVDLSRVINSANPTITADPPTTTFGGLVSSTTASTITGSDITANPPTTNTTAANPSNPSIVTSPPNPAMPNIPVRPPRLSRNFDLSKAINSVNPTTTADPPTTLFGGLASSTTASRITGSDITANPPTTNTTAANPSNPSIVTSPNPAMPNIPVRPPRLSLSRNFDLSKAINSVNPTTTADPPTTTFGSLASSTTASRITGSDITANPPTTNTTAANPSNPSIVTSPNPAMPNIPVRPPRLSLSRNFDLSKAINSVNPTTTADPPTTTFGGLASSTTAFTITGSDITANPVESTTLPNPLAG
ncbi:hypothetical protein EMCRGX_G001341 [Ephydatia muelleri]